MPSLKSAYRNESHGHTQSSGFFCCPGGKKPRRKSRTGAVANRLWRGAVSPVFPTRSKRRVCK
ncbi:hypothetical protein HMPREF0262_03052 [Clostridium sp. ATCC 29733]|nr:hypothetical protein HMPREF0262_03052 [Clostridium sp. ATCC 29733]